MIIFKKRGCKCTQLDAASNHLEQYQVSTCLSGSLVTNRDSSDVFETLVVAAAMDWARCSQLVVFFLFRLLLLGRDFPPISEQFSVILLRVGSKQIQRDLNWWRIYSMSKECQKFQQSNFCGPVWLIKYQVPSKYHKIILFLISVIWWSILLLLLFPAWRSIPNSIHS